MAVLSIEAKDTNLDAVNEFIHAQIAPYECLPKDEMQIDLSVEEIFVNIAHYAYGEGTGLAEVKCDFAADSRMLTISFRDSGVPFDPLAKPDPDITLNAEEREIGGLGIFITKKYMDSVDYRYENGNNILTLKKILGKK